VFVHMSPPSDLFHLLISIQTCLLLAALIQPHSLGLLFAFCPVHFTAVVAKARVRPSVSPSSPLHRFVFYQTDKHLYVLNAVICPYVTYVKPWSHVKIKLF